MPVNTLKDHKANNGLSGPGSGWRCSSWCCLSWVDLQLFYLQVVRYDELATQSDENRVVLQTIPPVRGLIYDNQGRLLAMNRSSRNLAIVRERVGDLKQLLAKLGELVPLSENEINRFEQRLRRRRPFEPFP